MENLVIVVVATVIILISALIVFLLLLYRGLGSVQKQISQTTKDLSWVVYITQQPRIESQVLIKLPDGQEFTAIYQWSKERADYAFKYLDGLETKETTNPNVLWQYQQ